jgi:hypothetical protein
MAASIEELSHRLTSDASAEQERTPLQYRVRSWAQRPTTARWTDGRSWRGIWIEPNLDSNRDRIANLSSWFTVSCGLLAVEVSLWTISVAG